MESLIREIPNAEVDLMFNNILNNEDLVIMSSPKRTAHFKQNLELLAAKLKKANIEFIKINDVDQDLLGNVPKGRTTPVLLLNGVYYTQAVDLFDNYPFFVCVGFVL